MSRVRLPVVLVVLWPVVLWLALPLTATQAPPAAPVYETFHIGIESWVLKDDLSWNVTLPPGSKIVRVYGQCSAAPVGGWQADDGVVRQALVWMLPHTGRSDPPRGVAFTLKPPLAKAFTNVDGHLMCVICKVAGPSAVHYHFDNDYSHAPRAVDDDTVRINVHTVSHKAFGMRTRWDLSKDPMDAIDFELQAFVTIVR